MAHIVAQIVNAGVPVNSLATDPRISIYRLDTGAAVVSAQDMTDVGSGGLYVYDFTPDPSLDYGFSIDADPLVSGQVGSTERFFGGGFAGTVDNPTPTELQEWRHVLGLTGTKSDPGAAGRIETNVLAAIAALNDLSSADIQAALTAQGYTSARGALLDNLDAAVSTVITAVGALNDLSAADVQSALTAQGYSSARAVLLDRLDALVSSRAVAGDQMALTSATLTAIQALILSDATAFSGADIAATKTATEALREYVEGGRELDFTGSDSLGWQRVERDTSNVVLRRYNLFDETDTRITGTVAAFLAAGKMISRETLV